MDVAALVHRWLVEERREVLTTLEALADQRVCDTDGIQLETLRRELALLYPEANAEQTRHALTDSGIAIESQDSIRLSDGTEESVRDLLHAAAMGRSVLWDDDMRRQGTILAEFARHCRDDLDGVEVAVVADGDAGAARLVVKDPQGESRIELRHGFLALESLAATPTLLIGDVATLPEDFLRSVAAHQQVRSAVAIFDLVHLEKVSAVRCSAFVLLEWFLRDAYDVRLVTPRPFTQALIDRGVISLGFG